jgi:hypothetical protein
MDPIASRPKLPLANQSFFALVFSLLGWGFLEAWLVGAHAMLIPHLVATSCALCLASVAVTRVRRYRELAGIAFSPVRRQERFTASDAGCAMFLLAVGVVLGALVLAGRILPLGIAATGIMFLPWRRASFYHRHVVTSCAAVLVGAAATVALGQQQGGPLFPLLASWLFWLYACVTLLRTPAGSARQAPDAAGNAL